MAVNFVSALGAGSGIDVKQLANDLVEAARAPRQAQIDTRIEKSEARISGYGVVRYALNEIKNAFAALNDKSEFSSLSTSNSQPSALGVRSTTAAAAGSYSIQVSQVAAATRLASGSYASATAPLNGGNAFSLPVTLGTGGAATTHTIAVAAGATTPQGLVAAINAAEDGSGNPLGLSAQLIQSSPGSYQVVVTGQPGASNAVAFDTTGLADLTLSTPLQTAADAQFTVNGLAITRAGNTVTDVIEGVTLDLYTTTSGSARVDFTRDTAAITEKVRTLVTAYNDFEDSLQILGDRGSEVEEFGGVLAGDSLLQTLRSQVRAMLVNTSSTPGEGVSAPRDVGLSFDRDGVLQFDEAKLASALQNRFADVVTMFTADTDNQSLFSTQAGGVAGDAVNRLDAMLRSTGLLAQQTSNATAAVERHKADLEKLELRMEQLLARYMQQFSAMESVVGQSNSLRDNLKNSFDGMMAVYTKR